jgi:hypothetical protein
MNRNKYFERIRVHVESFRFLDAIDEDDHPSLYCSAATVFDEVRAEHLWRGAKV